MYILTSTIRPGSLSFTKSSVLKSYNKSCQFISIIHTPWTFSFCWFRSINDIYWSVASDLFFVSESVPSHFSDIRLPLCPYSDTYSRKIRSYLLIWYASKSARFFLWILFQNLHSVSYVYNRKVFKALNGLSLHWLKTHLSKLKCRLILYQKQIK